jgi:hypothetical protein
MATAYRTIVLFVKKKINRWEKGAGRARQNKEGTSAKGIGKCHDVGKGKG